MVLPMSILKMIEVLLGQYQGTQDKNFSSWRIEHDIVDILLLND